MTALVPAVLALHLLARTNSPASRAIGLDTRLPGFDLEAGAALALVIGLPGLGLYFAAHALGINATVVPAALPGVWWAVPVLVLAAIQNALLEEILCRRLPTQPASPTGLASLAGGAGQRAAPRFLSPVPGLRWFPRQCRDGPGVRLGLPAMGGRVAPLVVAHTVLDVVSFVGYALLKDRIPGLS